VPSIRLSTQLRTQVIASELQFKPRGRRGSVCMQTVGRFLLVSVLYNFNPCIDKYLITSTFLCQSWIGHHTSRRAWFARTPCSPPAQHKLWAHPRPYCSTWYASSPNQIQFIYSITTPKSSHLTVDVYDPRRLRSRATLHFPQL
jgi:hypothetical protein